MHMHTVLTAILQVNLDWPDAFLIFPKRERFTCMRGSVKQCWKLWEPDFRSHPSESPEPILSIMSMCVCVCLSVRLHISGTTRVNFTSFFKYMLPVAVVWSSSGGGVVIRYVLPALWKTSYFPMLIYHLVAIYSALQCHASVKNTYSCGFFCWRTDEQRKVRRNANNEQQRKRRTIVRVPQGWARYRAKLYS